MSEDDATQKRRPGASAIALDAQGRLVVAGSVLDATWDIAVWRIE